MNIVALIMTAFSILGAVDKILGNRFGLGKEFDKGMRLIGNMILSMVGMIVLSPLIARLLTPVLDFMSGTLHLEPSILPALLLANDMGGAALAVQVAVDARLGMHNAMVVSAMMGCTVSFSIPYAMGQVAPAQHKNLLLGYLCGIVMVPVGCIVSGIAAGLSLGSLLLNFLPLILFSLLVAAGLWFIPMTCVRIFKGVGRCMEILVTLGLAIGILRFMTGVEIIPGLETMENGGMICLKAAVVVSGAFPLMYILSHVLKSPLSALGRKLHINNTSALGLLSTMASSMNTYGMMGDMDPRGVVLNGAFAVSATSAFSGHVAFTVAFNQGYLPVVLLGKLVSGLAGLALAVVICIRLQPEKMSAASTAAGQEVVK